jgi:hypothetical protein
MAPNLPFLADISNTLALPGLVGLGYLCLIVILALVAVFSSKPHRREAAFDVLRLVTPGRQPPSRTSRHYKGR